jgi:hypothetical protein
VIPGSTKQFQWLIDDNQFLPTTLLHRRYGVANCARERNSWVRVKVALPTVSWDFRSCPNSRHRRTVLALPCHNRKWHATLPRTSSERCPRFAERNLWNVARDHSGLRPANFTTLPHFAVSSAMSFPKSAGEPASNVPPRSASRALILGSASPALISLLSLSMIDARPASEDHDGAFDDERFPPNLPSVSTWRKPA